MWSIFGHWNVIVRPGKRSKRRLSLPQLLIRTRSASGSIATSTCGVAERLYRIMSTRCSLDSIPAVIYRNVVLGLWDFRWGHNSMQLLWVQNIYPCMDCMVNRHSHVCLPYFGQCPYHCYIMPWQSAFFFLVMDGVRIDAKLCHKIPLFFGFR